MRHSHSMRDQTSHMREKYQQHRRLSIRTPNGSNNNTPKVGMSNCLRRMPRGRGRYSHTID